MTIHDMQNLNRATMEYISSIIIPGMSLIEVRDLCESFMLSHGAVSFWYWDVGAFVFVVIKRQFPCQEESTRLMMQ